MSQKSDDYGYSTTAHLNGFTVAGGVGAGARGAFGYYGSKRRIASQILKRLPPHNCWVEVFCGSAALTMAKHPAQIEIINDLDDDIVNVFRQLRNRSEDLIEALAMTPYARGEFQAIRATKHEEVDDLERARRFLADAMMTVNGVVASNKGGFSFSNTFARQGMEARLSRWNSYPERLRRVVERLKNVRIEKRDGIELLDDFALRPATLLYIDPPYLTKRSSGYAVEADDRFHEKLLSSATQAKCMIAISGYDSDLYNDHLTESSGWTRLNLGSYTRTTNGKGLPREEILWTNAALSKAQRNNRVPIRLSQNEKEQFKINPIREYLVHRPN